MRHAAKIDDSQPDIVRGLKKIGASILHLARVGEGAPDLAVGFRGHNFLFEVKTPGSAHSKAKPGTSGHGKTVALQQAFYESWRGQVAVIGTFDDAVRVIANRLTAVAAHGR